MRVVAAVIALVAISAPAAVGAGGAAGTIVFAANRAPTLAGEVMRVDPTGKAASISRSVAADVSPAVSPDGKLVAFASARGGHTAEYVVGVDGTGLRRVSPFLGPAVPNGAPFVTASWSRDGKRLAVLVSPYAPGVPRLYLAAPRGGVWRLLTKPRDQPQRIVGWSPAGTVAYAALPIGTVRVLDVHGKVLLDAPGEGATWSPGGRLAVQRSSIGVDLYDTKLHRVGSFPAAAEAWSRSDVLATMTAKGVLQLRRHGVGRPYLSSRLGRDYFEVQWVGTSHLRSFGANGWVIVDARTGHTFLAAGAFAVYNSVVSADGTTALGERAGSTAAVVGDRALLRTRLGGSTTTLATTSACGSEGSAWENLQLLPDGSAVYDTAYCLVSSDIWSVGGAGGTPVQLTHTPTDETQPTLSPDRTHIAYTTQVTADGCKGCTRTVWLMNADGSGARAFPNDPDPDVNYDDSPSFSPDGRTILFARSGPNAAHLYTVPAAGGGAAPLGLDGLDPVWGPAKIAYGNLKDGISVADANGQNAVDLHVEGTAAWSQTGRLAVMRTSQKGLSIYFPAAKRSIALSGFSATYWGAGLAWSPDGTRLAFDGFDRQGISDVWTIGVDGTGLTRVTHDLGVVGTLGWR